MKRSSLLLLPAILRHLQRRHFLSALSGRSCSNQASRTRVAASPTPTLQRGHRRRRKLREESEVYKVDTELVNLNVRVVDRNNRPINGLSQNDFKIFEDGAPQSIEFFSKSEVPTNYALVIDNSGSLRSQLEKVIDAGKMIVATNRPDDETSIIRFVSREKISIEQPFTANKADLNDALDNLFIEGGQTASSMPFILPPKK